jgi:anti-sigma B factor antagonist
MSSSALVTVLALDGELGIYRATELRDTLLKALAGLPAGATLELNLAEVSELDSAGVQLLIAAKKAAQAAQHDVRLVGHSPAVLEVFETLDLAGHFNDPLLLPAAIGRQA